MTEVRKPGNPEVDKVLVLNAAHIPFEDSRLLEEYEPPLVLARFPYGWLVPVDVEAAKSSFLSPAFIRMLEFAKGMNANWVRLDHDGPLMEGMPSYEWGRQNISVANLKMIYQATVARDKNPEKILASIRSIALTAMNALGYRNEEDLCMCLGCGKDDAEGCSCPLS